MGINKELESEYEEIKEFLNKLESISGQVSENEISEKIKTFAKEKFGQNPPNILLWEQMAFDFTENYLENKSGWKTYFRPMLVFSNKEGKFVEYPSIKRITPQIIAYWEDRAGETKHPILRARYSNLVWDFSKKIIGKKAHYKIAQIFIDSTIEIAERGLHKYPIEMIKKLERALSLALSINDKKRIDKIKKAIIDYENKIAEDDKPGLWGFPYELLVKNKKVPLGEDEEKKIIATLEQRFEGLLKKNDIWPAKRAAILLVDYYKRTRKLKEVKRILLNLGNIIQQKAEQVSAILGSAWLEGLYHFYLKYGLKREADKISIKIKELGIKSSSDLKKVKTAVEIPKSEINELINKLIEGNLNAALERTAVYYIPRKNKVIKQLEELSKKAPTFFFTHKIQDHEGRVIASVGSLEEDIDGHIILQISQNMQFASFFLRETINALIHKFNLDEKTIVDYLYESPIFEEKRKKFFIKGINAYLNDDFLVALHMLIPQIEALIRNLAEKIGVSVLKPSRSGGFYYKTLDEILRDENMIKVLGENMCLYFRILLTDSRGWNLRNNICHGISSLETFNQIAIDRVFHVLLCLSLVKEKENKMNLSANDRLIRHHLDDFVCSRLL